MKVNVQIIMRHFVTVVILIFLNLESCISHSIVGLVVPAIADPRDTAILSCKYDMDGDHLYSAKWLKDGQEIFRYMPGGKPAGLPFPVPGVRLARPPRCSPVTCDLELTDLAPLSAGLYRCEISTEAPTFRIAYKSANMTVAALPQRDPLVEGAATVYSLGEEIRLNCTSDPSLPPADLTWYINDEEAMFPYVDDSTVSGPDGIGLSTRTMSLRLRAERWLFRPVASSSGGPAKEMLLLRCESMMPKWLPGGPHKRQFSIAASLRHTSSQLNNQQLKWPGNAAQRPRILQKYLFHCIVLLLFL